MPVLTRTILSGAHPVQQLELLKVRRYGSSQDADRPGRPGGLPRPQPRVPPGGPSPPPPAPGPGPGPGARQPIRSLARATAVHAISPPARSELLATVGVSPEKVFVAHLGVGTEFLPASVAVT